MKSTKRDITTPPATIQNQGAVMGLKLRERKCKQLLALGMRDWSVGVFHFKAEKSECKVFVDSPCIISSCS